MPEVRLEGHPEIAPEEHPGFCLGVCGSSMAVHGLLYSLLSTSLDESCSAAQ
jgi:hypothetical protein